MERREDENHKDHKRVMVIRNDFQDFNRIFYQRDEKKNLDLLTLVSIKKQLFMHLNLENHQMTTLNLNAGKKYQQIEVYDNKFFCIDKESFTMDIFFLTKKQNSYHKRVIRFANKGLKLKDNFRLIIWKQREAGVAYRCLLGPLEDGKYMNFDLLERYFDYKTDINQIIGNMVFIRLANGVGREDSDNIICTVDEAKKSIICFSEEKQKFFEYNGFAGENSRFLEVMNDKKIRENRIKRMYFFNPYEFFSQKKKNQLKTLTRNMGKTDVEVFVKNLYREVLVCMENGILLKMALLGDAALSNSYIWEITDFERMDTTLTDIAINEYTGEIYCLCEQEIQIFKSLETELVVMYEQKMIRKKILEDNYNS